MSRPRLNGERATPLTAEERAYMIQCYRAGLKYREIAQAMDRPYGTIAWQIMSLRQKGVIGWDRI